MDLAQMKKIFNMMAEDYEEQSMSTTRNIFKKSIQYLPPITSSSVIHDNACGPGIVAEEVMREFLAAHPGESPPIIHATDFSDRMVEMTAKKAQDNGWTNIKAAEMDAQNLEGLEDNLLTHSITNFLIPALPNQIKGLKEIHRTLKPGGTAYVNFWTSTQMIFTVSRTIQRAIRPDLPLWQEGINPWLEKGKMVEALKEAGFTGEIKEYFVETDCPTNDLEELVDMFKWKFFEAMKVGWTEEDRKRWEPESRTALAEMLRTQGKGPFNAWVTVATK